MQRLELPHNHRGEVDWNTLGNILSAHLLGEVLCASYIDHKYGKRESYVAETAWEFAYEEHNVIVLRKKLEDSPISAFMGRGVIDCPMDDVVLFVGNILTRKLWDSLLVEVKTAKRLSDTDVIIYLRHRTTRCLVKQEREFLYYERMTHIDGKYVQTAMSVDIPEFPPTNITRAQVRPGTGWVIEPYEGDKTLITYCAHVDLQALPPIIMNRVMRRQPMAIRYIRKILTNPLKKRSFEESCASMFTESDQHAVEEQLRSIGSSSSSYSSRSSSRSSRSSSSYSTGVGGEGQGHLKQSKNKDPLMATGGKMKTRKPSPLLGRGVNTVVQDNLETIYNSSGDNRQSSSIDTQESAQLEAQSSENNLQTGEYCLDRSSPVLSYVPHSLLGRDDTDKKKHLDIGSGICLLPLQGDGPIPVSSDLEASCQSALSPDQCYSLPTVSLAATKGKMNAKSIPSKAYSTEAIPENVAAAVATATGGNLEQTHDSNSESSQESLHAAGVEAVGPKDCSGENSPRNGFQSTSDSACSSLEKKQSCYPNTISPVDGDQDDDDDDDFCRERLGTEVFDITVSL